MLLARPMLVAVVAARHRRLLPLLLLIVDARRPTVAIAAAHSPHPRRCICSLSLTTASAAVLVTSTAVAAHRCCRTPRLQPITASCRHSSLPVIASAQLSVLVVISAAARRCSWCGCAISSACRRHSSLILAAGVARCSCCVVAAHNIVTLNVAASRHRSSSLCRLTFSPPAVVTADRRCRPSMPLA